MDPETSVESPPGNARRVLGSIGVVIVVVAVVFAIYTVRTRDRLASQALHVTKTFIKSSPVVEEDLGRVVSMKELSEKRVDGKGWVVDYTVTGKKAQGTVDFVVKKNGGSWGSWKVVQADLKTGHGKPSDLL